MEFPKQLKDNIWIIERTNTWKVERIFIFSNRRT